jgi:hypothetical protein
LPPTPVPTGATAFDIKYGGRLHKNRQRSQYQLSPERGTLKAATGRDYIISYQNEPKNLRSVQKGVRRRLL